MTAQKILTTTKKLKVSLWSEGDKLKYKAPEGVLTDEMRANIRRLKPELLALLESAPAHRWRDDPTGDASATDAAAPDVAASAAPDVAASAATGSAAAMPAIPDDLPHELTATEAARATLDNAYFNQARATLDNAYFNQARGGVWCIGWQQPSRSAWRYACTVSGGQLIGANRVPDMEASAAIDWAKTQLEITTNV